MREERGDHAPGMKRGKMERNIIGCKAGRMDERDKDRKPKGAGGGGPLSQSLRTTEGWGTEDGNGRGD